VKIISKSSSGTSKLSTSVFPILNLETGNRTNETHKRTKQSKFQFLDSAASSPILRRQTQKVQQRIRTWLLLVFDLGWLILSRPPGGHQCSVVPCFHVTGIQFNGGLKQLNNDPVAQERERYKCLPEIP
jgi:hypothetical protein